MHKGHRALIKLLLVELPALDLLGNFVLYTWHSKVHFRNSSYCFEWFETCTTVKIYAWHVHKGDKTDQIFIARVTYD